MTREAKIGLLVALSFLLVIGILLSDHVTVSTREPAAPLANSADTVRGSIRAPGGNAIPAAGIAPVLPDQGQQGDPRHGGSTRFEYNGPRDPGHVHVEMGTPSQHPTQPRSDHFVSHFDAGEFLPPDPGLEAWQPTPLTHDHSAPLAGEEQRRVDDPFAEVEPTPSTGNIFEDLARQMGEPVVTQRGGQSQQQVAAVTDYVAQPGDSLSRITARVLGRDTPANREVILKLNPALRDNPDLIVVGRSYKVPADAEAARTLAQSQQASRPPGQSGSAEPGRESSTPPKPRTYTVQSGDSLWRIAERELGNPNRRSEILALNRSVITNEDQLQVGMVLRLPE